MNSIFLWPIISILVLPIGWLEYKLLQKSRWGVLLGILNLVVLYGPWIIVVYCSFNQPNISLTTVIGFGMVIIALILWRKATPLLFKARGQVMTVPKNLVAEGPYRWTRHPLYVGHVLLISGGMLASGALEIFLETPILWIIAAIASKYEEKTRLEPLFGETFRQYQAQIPFLLPFWAWAIWGIIYLAVAIRLFLF